MIKRVDIDPARPVPPAIPVRARHLVLGLLAGALWGAIGRALARDLLGPPVWGGVIASPAIGVLIAVAFRGFKRHPPGARIALALVSLYLAAGLFGLGAGIADALRPLGDRKLPEVVLQSVLGVWWGMTLTGYVFLLWPASYLTHVALARAAGSEEHNGA